MDRNDPRIKEGIHVRAVLYYSNGRSFTTQGWLINPARVLETGPSAGWPASWSWGYVTHHATFTRERWERDIPGVRISDERHQELMDPHKMGRFWMGVSEFENMEYLDAGFSEPAKPKNRRGKRHKMRVGL